MLDELVVLEVLVVEELLVVEEEDVVLDDDVVVELATPDREPTSLKPTSELPCDSTPIQVNFSV